VKAVVVLCMLGSRTASAGSPYDAVYTARDDCRKQAAEIQRYLRYLWHPHVERDEELRNEFRRALAFHVNSLSTEPELVNPYPVGDSLWRLNILDYGWKPEVWARLADVDPYFHADLDVTEVRTAYRTVTKYRTEQVQYYGRSYTNQVPYTEQEAYEVKETKRVRAFAPWLPPGAIKELSDLTYSKAPILRGDWFLFQTAIQEGRKAGYYDFLNLGKQEKDFQRLVGADLGLSRERKTEQAAVVGRSAVTLNNRVIEWYPAQGGDYWRSLDYKEAVGKRNVVRFLDGDQDREDASEQYGPLPNGLFAVWLQNGQGQRQNIAPDFIASDGAATGTDRRVHVGLSCFRCHEEGLRPVESWLHSVYDEKTGAELTSADYGRLKRLRRRYLADFADKLEAGQARYAVALRKVNGLSPARNAAGYGKTWYRYADQDVTAEALAREVGSPTARRFQDALRAYTAAVKLADPVLVGLSVGRAARREHIEEAFPLVMEVYAGYRPGPPKEKER
jgi:hypothetical protein